jgi:5-bromo-4-chloroindolyl phosphate hydrolysis protein
MGNIILHSFFLCLIVSTMILKSIIVMSFASLAIFLIENLVYYTMENLSQKLELQKKALNHDAPLDEFNQAVGHMIQFLGIY